MPPVAGRHARTSPISSTRGRSSSTAASRSRRSAARRDVDDLIARTPADGLVAGTARINGDQFGDERSACAVLSYDYTVLAGTQGALGHRKKDRLFELIERHATSHGVLRRGWRRPARRHRLPGGVRARRPGVRAVGRAVGRGAAHRGREGPVLRRQRGHRRLLRPHRRHRGRLDRHGRAGDDRRRRPRAGRRRRRSGRSRCRRRTASSTSWSPTRPRRCAVTKQLLGYFQGSTPPGDRSRPDADARPASPSAADAPTTSRRSSTTLADEGSVTFLRERFAREMVTALARIEGRPVGVIANDTLVMAGAVTAAGRRQGGALPAAVRRVRRCRSSRSSTRPGTWSGPTPRPRRWCAVRRGCSSAGAALRVPLVAVILRRGYGLGAQAMVRRQPARAAADGRLAERPPRAHGPRGRGAPRAAQGARGDRRRRRARAAGARGDRRAPGAGQGDQRRRSCSRSTT